MSLQPPLVVGSYPTIQSRVVAHQLRFSLLFRLAPGMRFSLLKRLARTTRFSHWVRLALAKWFSHTLRLALHRRFSPPVRLALAPRFSLLRRLALGLRFSQFGRLALFPRFPHAPRLALNGRFSPEWRLGTGPPPTLPPTRVPVASLRLTALTLRNYGRLASTSHTLRPPARILPCGVCPGTRAFGSADDLGTLILPSRVLS